MSAGVEGNFINNFCSKRLAPEDLELFDADECRVRVRDIAKNRIGFFSGRQTNAQKYEVLVQLRDRLQRENRITEEQLRTCNANLKVLHPAPFREKENARAERSRYFYVDIRAVRGVDPEKIERYLIDDGKVKVTAKGIVVPADQSVDDVDYFEIQYDPGQEDQESSVLIVFSKNSRFQIKESSPQGEQLYEADHDMPFYLKPETFHTVRFNGRDLFSIKR